eukprot:8787206-Pyramimonas_sp.AAC.1
MATRQRSEYRPLLKVALPDTQRENVVKLKKFIKFENTAEALGAAACLVDSKLDKSTAYCRIKKLKTGLDRKKGKHWTVCLHSYSCALHVKLPRPSLHAYISLCLVNKALPKVSNFQLKKFLKKHCEDETLAVADPKLGNIVKEKLGIPCVHRFVSSLLQFD